MRVPRPLIAVIAGAALGLLFASVSTYDFVQHLDRQVHDLHCSFVPGLIGAEPGAGSGCQTTLMSPYSSIARGLLWGGLPITLMGMSVFAFIIAYAADLLVRRRTQDPQSALVLLLATAIPLATSVVMAILSFAVLDAACKVCIGIYISSALTFGGAFVQWRRLRTALRTLPTESAAEAVTTPMSDPAPSRSLAMAAGLLAVFVATPVLAYVAMAPSHEAFIAACGTLSHPRDPYNVFVSLGGPDDGPPLLEALDPLCPACRALEERLVASSHLEEMHRQAVLFPLDSTCNWMVDRPIHPGACTVSEAVLCAGERAPEVLAWAFTQQDEIRAKTGEDPQAARRMVTEKFPDLRSCVGSATARTRLNRSLRWVVRNRLQVLTPQLYLAGVRVCNEDLDLGLTHTLGALIDRHRAGTLPKVKEPEPEPMAAVADPNAVPAGAVPEEQGAAGAAGEPTANPEGTPPPAPTEGPGNPPPAAVDTPAPAPANVPAPEGGAEGVQ